MTVLSSQQEIEILITEAEIAARTTQLAHIISDHYRGTKQLVVVGLLRGLSFSLPTSCGASIYRSRWIS